MRAVWVSFDTMGRDTLLAAREAGAEVVGVVTLPGPIVGQLVVPVAPDETATTLFDKLARAHVELVREFVSQRESGVVTKTPQDPSRASAWPKRTPADGIIDWETRAPYLYDWVRAQTRPYPGAFTFLGGEKVVIWSARPVEWAGDAPAGTVVDAGPVVACGEGALLLEEVETSAPLEVGARLG